MAIKNYGGGEMKNFLRMDNCLPRTFEWKFKFFIKVLLGQEKYCWHKWIKQWRNEYSKGNTYECCKCGKWKNYRA